jgi:hypothetical protein
MWSHDQGKVFAGVLVQIHEYDGCERARDIGLTAGRWTSLAAHYCGVFVCFGMISLYSANTLKSVLDCRDFCGTCKISGRFTFQRADGIFGIVLSLVSIGYGNGLNVCTFTGKPGCK